MGTRAPTPARGQFVFPWGKTLGSLIDVNLKLPSHKGLIFYKNIWGWEYFGDGIQELLLFLIKVILTIL